MCGRAARVFNDGMVGSGPPALLEDQRSSPDPHAYLSCSALLYIPVPLALPSWPWPHALPPRWAR